MGILLGDGVDITLEYLQLTPSIFSDNGWSISSINMNQPIQNLAQIIDT